MEQRTDPRAAVALTRTLRWRVSSKRRCDGTSNLAIAVCAMGAGHGAAQPQEQTRASADALRSVGVTESPRVSPDGTRVIVGTDDGSEAAIWTYRLSGASALQRVTFGGNNRFPVWSSDSTRVAFQSDGEDDHGIFWQRVHGTGTAERLTTPDRDDLHEPEAWSPTGDVLMFSVTQGADVALWTLSLADRTVKPFGDVHSSTRTGAVFSPDGRWVAYASSEGQKKKTIYNRSRPRASSMSSLRMRPSCQIIRCGPGTAASCSTTRVPVSSRLSAPRPGRRLRSASRRRSGGRSEERALSLGDRTTSLRTGGSFRLSRWLQRTHLRPQKPVLPC